MTIGSAFRAVADTLDEFEAAGFEIAEAESRGGDGHVAVEFAASVSAIDVIEDEKGVDVRIEDATVSDDGRVTFGLSATVGADGEDRRRPENEERTGGDREAERVSEAVDPSPDEPDSPGGERGVNRNTEEDVEESEATRGDEEERGPPPHRDPEKLRAAYREHDTFAEMTDALDVDVTSQTVRRYMIEHGIHEPSPAGGGDEPEGEAPSTGASDTGSDSDDGAGRSPEKPGEETDERATRADGDRDRNEATVPDGIGLPAGTDLDELKRAVQSSRTVYEVSRTLDIDRERTRRLLDELDLLDLVTGRLARDHEVTAEEVRRRVERAAPGSA